jgi:hypothetical protein
MTCWKYKRGKEYNFSAQLLESKTANERNKNIFRGASHHQNKYKQKLKDKMIELLHYMCNHRFKILPYKTSQTLKEDQICSNMKINK